MLRDEKSLILAIISDQSLVRNLKHLLQGTNFRVEVAPNGETGLLMADELLPDAVLVDIDLDDDSLGTCRKLRANRVLQGTPVLMLCNYNDSDSRVLRGCRLMVGPQLPKLKTGVRFPSPAPVYSISLSAPFNRGSHPAPAGLSGTLS